MMTKRLKYILTIALLICATMVQGQVNTYQNTWYEITKQGLSSDGTGIAWCCYNYHSTDALGNPITLSAFMRLGKNYYKDSPSVTDLDNIVLMEHYTITNNSACPTENFTSTSCYEARSPGNNLVIVPDYIGFGLTKDSLQAYLNHECAAKNSYDALLAGYRIFMEKASVKLKDHWRLFVGGASQGGGNALAVHKYLEEHHLDKRWRFAYSYCCDGPYDPTTTMKTYWEWESLDSPFVIPMTLKAMLASYPDVLGKWKEDEFYSSTYLAHKDEIDAAFASKDKTTTTINNLFINYFNDGSSKVRLGTILSAEALDTTTEMSKALFTCLEKNNLTRGWTPRNKIKLYYSTKDEVVPYANTQAVIDAFGDMVTTVKCAYQINHVTTCGLWFSVIGSDFSYDETYEPEVLDGDINRDGIVDVSDITALMAKILNETGVDLDVDDVNCDGNVDVSDVTALMSIILK